jgi:hypothetical protein
LIGACTIKAESSDDDGAAGDSPDATGGISQGGTPATGGAPTGGYESGGVAGAPDHVGGAGGSPDAGPTGGKAAGGSAGGPSEAGSGGESEPPAGGGQGGAGEPPADASDSCDGAETMPNEDRRTATSYTLGTAFHACLQNQEDVDFYEFTTPDDSRGGYVTVAITDVGDEGDTAIELFTAEDNGSFRTTGTNTEGASVFAYFTAKPATTFRISVTNYVAVTAANPYTLTAEYHQVPDVHEPNDSRPDAKLITVGASVEGYMHAGRSVSTGIPAADFQDWFEVALEPGDVTILLSIVAADNDGDITLFDPLGTEIDSAGSNTDGSSVELESTIEEAGSYFVRVNPYVPPVTDGATATIPQYLTKPYTLTVTQ